MYKASVCLIVTTADFGLVAQHGRRCCQGCGSAQLSAGEYHVSRGDGRADSVLSGPASGNLLPYQTVSTVVP